MTDEIPMIDPRRTALVAMDFQNGIVPRAPDPDGLLGRVAAALRAARAAGLTIAHVRVGFTAQDIAQMPETAAMRQAALRGDAVDADGPATQIDGRVAPVDGDLVVRKIRVGAFSSTDLDAQLRERGIDTLVLAGLATSGAVLSTVRDAADRDYRQLVLSDGCADPDPEVHDFLVGRVFPRHATVLTVAELERVLAG